MSQKLPTVAIIGQANVGKSSLFNRLVRARQAIVAREAGTTRDRIIGKVTYRRTRAVSQKKSGLASAGPGLFSDDTGGDGDRFSEFWLVDTAGLKTAEDEFEATIQEQIEDAVASADAIIVMVDSTLYPTDSDRMIAKKALKSQKPVVLVTNKIDIKGALSADEFKRLSIKTIIRTSAEHNTGVSELLDHLATILPPAIEQPNDDVLRVALIGRPNVGKSHLFNTLAGKQQAIVANIAGTTRDLNRLTLNYKKQAIELIDTAGIRRQGKQETGIEKFSVLRTMQAINEADVCLLLMDVNELNVGLDQRLAGLIDEAGKGLILVVSKWDSVEDKDAYTHDALVPQISYHFKFTPYAPLIFTSSVTGQNVTKLFDLALDIHQRRRQEIKTRQLNDLLQRAVAAHPPAGLKNSHPKLRYMVQTDVAPPWFVIYGSNLKFIHWSYKRYLERTLREAFDFAGTPIKLSFRDEKQLKKNRERIRQGKEPVTKAYKQAKEAEKCHS